MERDEVFEETWETRKNVWLPYVKIDVLSTAFWYASYFLSLEKILILG